MATASNAHPFGFWPSPISAASVATGALRFGRVQIADGAVFWSEGRPSEGGRAAIMCWRQKDGLAELLPPPYSARSRVHEYGGGEFLTAAGQLFFVNDGDQDVYALELGKPGADGIVRLTSTEAMRFADFALDAARNRLIAIAEIHSSASGAPENLLCGIPFGRSEPPREPMVLQRGRGFYASPRMSADGTALAFLAWDLPDMPWDAAALYVAKAAPDGSFDTPVRIAGGDGRSCFQPEWGPDGALYFVSDADGFGNLHRWTPGAHPKQITRFEAELSKPLWSLGATSYAFVPGNRIYLSFVDNGEQRTGIYDPAPRTFLARDHGLTAIQGVAGGDAGVATLALTDRESQCVALVEVMGQESDPGGLAPPRPPLVLRRSGGEGVDPAYVSVPRRIEMPGWNGGTVFGLFYPPRNPDARGPGGKSPPLIINLHGGPTTATARGLKPRTLFFTSRGFGWLDLDYSGSTGYGRAYRDRLKGFWGVRDVADTIAAGEFAAASGLADPTAMFVTGGSAGGYTVLMTIAASALFRGAASYYGICDLAVLQRTTHKFEQGYLEGLLGATLEARPDLYSERSALSQAGRIATPLILFQGAEDRVVPKGQARLIEAALRERQCVVELHEFPGEGHGFRKAETISRALELELGFFRKLLDPD